MINTEETLNHLAVQIRNTDWSYDRSDDYGAYQKGRGQVAACAEIMKQHLYDDEDIAYLKKAILDDIGIKETWTEEFKQEVINYWSSVVDRLV